MRYYSLNNITMKYIFRKPWFKVWHLIKDYIFPENITPIENVFYDKIENLSNEEIAFEGDFKSKASNSFTNWKPNGKRKKEYQNYNLWRVKSFFEVKFSHRFTDCRGCTDFYIFWNFKNLWTKTHYWLSKIESISSCIFNASSLAFSAKSFWFEA